MTYYNLVMGQAVVLYDFQNNGLSTGGSSREDQVQSCSVVIVASTKTSIGGMYHYPSGPLAKDGNAQQIVKNMIAFFKPDLALVVYGNVSQHNVQEVSKKDFYTGKFIDTGAYDLRGLVQQFVEHVRILPARTGRVSAGLAHGKIVVDDQKVSYTDLANCAAGSYNFGLVYR